MIRNVKIKKSKKCQRIKKERQLKRKKTIKNNAANDCCSEGEDKKDIFFFKAQ